MDRTAERSEEKIPNSSVLQLLVVLALIGLALFTVSVAAKTVTGDALPQAVSVALEASDISADLPAGVEIVDVRALLAAEVETAWRVAWGLGSLLPELTAGWGLCILYGLARDKSDPFTKTNVRRLRTLSRLAIAYLALIAIRTAIETALLNSIGIQVIEFDFPFFVPYIVALLCSVMADMWHRGVAMREEQELTI